MVSLTGRLTLDVAGDPGAAVPISADSGRIGAATRSAITRYGTHQVHQARDRAHGRRNLRPAGDRQFVRTLARSYSQIGASSIRGGSPSRRRATSGSSAAKSAPLTGASASVAPPRGGRRTFPGLSLTLLFLQIPVSFFQFLYASTYTIFYYATRFCLSSVMFSHSFCLLL